MRVDGVPVAMETGADWNRRGLLLGLKHPKRKSRVGGFLKRETMAAGCGQVDRSGVRSKSGGTRRKIP
jgi:hypothetical protein